MTHVPASSHGGGGGLPTGWTQDADGNVTVAPADALLSQAQIYVVAPANSNDAIAVTDSAHPTGIAGAIDPFGYISGSGIALAATGNSVVQQIDGGTGVLTSRDLAQWILSSAFVARINRFGTFLFKKNAAPADAEVNASEFALWLDNTNGAGKLMVKAKTADGTVVTAAITLA